MSLTQDTKDKTIKEREVTLLKEATSHTVCKVESTILKDKDVDSKNDTGSVLETLVDKIGFRKDTLLKP